MTSPSASRAHNLREWTDEHPEPGYLLPPEHRLGHWREIQAADPGAVHAAKMALATGKARSMKEYSPVWEGVLNLPHPTGDIAADRQRFGSMLRQFRDGYERITGHKVLAADIHMDEGRVEDGQPIYNTHGHVAVDRTDDRGRPIRLTKDQLRQVQDLAAAVTGLARGEDASTTRRRHLPHQAYRGLARAGRVRARDDQARVEAATAEAIQEAEKRGLRRGRTQALVSGQASGQQIETAELYGELRGLMKASGRATQERYQEARQRREDRAWLEKQIEGWTDWIESRRKAQADDLAAIKDIRSMLPEPLRAARRDVLVPVVRAAFDAAVERPQARPVPVPVAPPPLPPAEPVSVPVTSHAERSRQAGKDALARSLRDLSDAVLLARAQATRQALLEAEAAIRRDGLTTATLVRKQSFADGWEVISQVMQQRGLGLPAAAPASGPGQGKPPQGRGRV